MLTAMGAESVGFAALLGCTLTFAAPASVVLSTTALAQATISAPIGVSGVIDCDGKGHVDLAITINGKITPQTAQDVEKLFRAYHAAEQGDQSSCTHSSGFGAGDKAFFGINSNGGDAAAAMTIGRLFRKEQAYVNVYGHCMSSCVLILAGAVDRSVSRDNIVGIHRPYLVSGRTATVDEIAAKYSSSLAEIKSYLQEMNVAAKLATDMLAVEPEAVRMLSLKELQSYGLLGVDPAEQERRAVDREIRDLREAERLGIDRIEYLRRKTRAKVTCAAEKGRSHIECSRRILETGSN